MAINSMTWFLITIVNFDFIFISGFFANRTGKPEAQKTPKGTNKPPSRGNSKTRGGSHA